MTASEKKCSACQHIKPASDFYADARASTGLMSRCKACHLQTAAAYRLRHPEVGKVYREANRDSISARKRAHTKAHPEQAVERLRRWRARHHDEARRQENVARKLLRNKALRTSILARDEHRCLCCGVVEDLCVDHIVPILQGGTNDPDNLQTLCRPCNTRKQGQSTDYRRRSA